MPGFLNVDANKALQAGLTFRPLSETLGAILDWESRGGSQRKIGLAPEKEQALLKQWEQVGLIPKRPNESGT
jgi:2'-hydroxyisoflavone reductase